MILDFLKDGLGPDVVPIVGRFTKVSYEQFRKDIINLYGNNIWDENEIKSMYDNITLPTRSSTKSAGYDFVSPFSFALNSKTEIIIPTGIRAIMLSNMHLDLYPRSGHGFKHGIRLANTTGIIDADYCDSDNEGHIMVKLFYDGKRHCKINVNDNKCVEVSKDTKFDYDDEQFIVKAGDKFVQGIFNDYGITENDNATGKRNGGFGSSDKNKYFKK